MALQRLEQATGNQNDGWEAQETGACELTGSNAIRHQEDRPLTADSQRAERSPSRNPVFDRRALDETQQGQAYPDARNRNGRDTQSLVWWRGLTDADFQVKRPKPLRRREGRAVLRIPTASTVSLEEEECDFPPLERCARNPEVQVQTSADEEPLVSEAQGNRPSATWRGLSHAICQLKRSKAVRRSQGRVLTARRLTMTNVASSGSRPQVVMIHRCVSESTVPLQEKARQVASM